MKWTVVAMVSVMVACVDVKKAGQELCVTRKPAIHCAAKTECVRMGSVSVTRDGQESTAILVSGSNTSTDTKYRKSCQNAFDCYFLLLFSQNVVK